MQDKELPDGSLQNEPKRSFMVLFFIFISFSFLIGSNSAKSLIFTSPSFIIQFVSYIRKKIVAQFYLVNVQPYHITRSISKSTRLFILTGKDVTL